MKKAIITTILTTAVLSQNAFSAQPQSTRFGVGVSAANFTVNDPDGSTGDTSLGYLSGLMVTPLSRNHPYIRVFSELSYRRFTLEPGVNTVGQQVTSLSLSGIAQHAFNVSQTYRPWVGLGFQAGLNDYKNRHTVDGGGFLDQQYADRSQTSFNILLNAGLSFKHVAFNITYHSPLDDGIEGVQLQMFYLFKGEMFR
ncbi:MAG: porin family protein [Gammaproteobacteria bacterium]|nr:porin family protein [Gammaproteobacteria bacterium]